MSHGIQPRIGIFILTVLYAVGLFGTLLGKEELLKLSAINLLLSLFVILWYQQLTKSFLIYALLVYMLGFVIEWLGVTTGRIFGQYFYGNNLGIKLLDIPLIIGVNWLLLSYSSLSVTNLLSNKIKLLANPFLFALVATILMVSVDVLIEPLCARLDFWFWRGGQAPLENFTAWFFFAFAFNFLGVKLQVPCDNKVAAWAWLLQVIFFLSLGVFWV